MTKIIGGAAAGLDGVTARGEGVISDAEPVGESGELTPDELREIWDSFFKGLSSDEVNLLAKGKADPDLSFRMLEMENSVIPKQFYNRFLPSE